MLGIGEVLT
jgi:hypothetical protein